MNALEFHFERLLAFVEQYNFSCAKPTNQVYFFLGKTVNYQEQPVKIPTELLISFSNFEKDFDKLLNQGHSWINLSLVGNLGEKLLIEVDYPNYENNCPQDRVSVNLSLQQHPNFDASERYKIV